MTATPSEWQRIAEIRQEQLEEISKKEDQKKNRNFVQVYDPFWQRLQNLMRQGKTCARLYAFLAQHIDASTGAVVASQSFLAKHLGVSTKTISRMSEELEGLGAMVRIPVQGRLYAYAMHPQEVWRGYNNSKRYAAFNSKTLADQNGEIRRRLKAMVIAEGHDPDEILGADLSQDELDLDLDQQDGIPQSQQ